MDIEIVEVAPRRIIYLSRTTGSEPEEIGVAMRDCYETLFSLLSEQRIMPLGAPLAIFDVRDGARTTFRAGFPVDEGDSRRMSESALSGETPGGPALRAVHRGPRVELAGVHDRLKGHVAMKGFIPAGPPWEVYLTGGDGTPETEIYLPVAARA